MKLIGRRRILKIQAAAFLAKMKRGYVTCTLLLISLLALILSGCGSNTNPPVTKQQGGSGSNSIVPPTQSASKAADKLPEKGEVPPPALVTVPAGAVRANLADLAEATGEEQSILSGTIDPDKVLESEVDALLASLKRGEVLFSSSTGQSAGVKTAYTYRDLNGDGVQDLVVIIVADQGGVVSVSAGVSEDGTAIQLAPKMPGEDSVQALSVELPGLAEVASLGETEEDAPQAVILKLEGDQLKIVTALD
jgi:hypothetical protein